MQSKKVNRIMIAGTNSGCGKTTITCAILKAIMNMGKTPASFKCGPDYIDPMFHSEVIGTKSRNLDFYLCGEKTAKYLLAKNSEDTDISIVEGVMGFYDGISGNTIEYSSCDISNKLEIPVVLVVNCRGAFMSVVANIKGHLDLFPNKIEAVILNNVSEMMFPSYKEMIESKLDIKVLGFMPKEPKAVIESRHLGLVTAAEMEDLNKRIEILAENVKKYIDLEALFEISERANELEYEELINEKVSSVKIAVAKDKAFCFYYEDSLSLFEDLGADLVSFSPLRDSELPENIDGLILGGGYPELYLEDLSNNKSMLESIKNSYGNGLPIFAECGGYMYLGNEIEGYKMADVIPMKCEMTKKLQNFGYVTLTAKKDTLLLADNEQIMAHEFHYSLSDNENNSLEAKKRNGKKWEAGYCEKNIFALYPHIHLWGNIKAAKRWIQQCESYKNNMQ